MTPLQMELHSERKARLARMAPRPRLSAPIPAPAIDKTPIATWFRFLPDDMLLPFPIPKPFRLEDIEPGQLRIENIQRVIAEHFGVTLLDLNSARRTANVVRPRQIAMYLSRKLTGKSLPEIGRRSGGRDHTTVLHACTVCERILGNEERLATDIRELFAKLKPYAPKGNE